MFRGRVVAGTVVLCTVGSIATAQAPQGFGGDDGKLSWSASFGGDRSTRGLVRNPPRWPSHEPVREVREARTKEYVIQAGRCYTSIVITPSGKGGTRRLTLTEGHQPFSIVVGNESLVLSFGKGWDVNCRVTICGELCDGDFEVFGVTERGPVAFAACYR